jgi:hypothetical protein
VVGSLTWVPLSSSQRGVQVVELDVPNIKHAELYRASFQGDSVICRQGVDDALHLHQGTHPGLMFDVSVGQITAIRSSSTGSFTMSLHQLGGPIVDLRKFGVVSKKSFSPLRPVYGPGTDRPLLPAGNFHGLGRPIDRDNPQVISAFSRWHDGQLWMRPLFPSTCYFEEWSLDGRRIQAALCQSIDVPGGFVLLEPPDLVRAYGYTDLSLRRAVEDFTVEDLNGLVPLEPLHRIVSWVEQQTQVNHSVH